MEPFMTTAEMLGAFLREMTDEGIGEALREDLVRMAAHGILRDGVGLSTKARVDA